MQPHLAFTNFLGRRLHLGVCGSVAAYKAAEVLRGVLGCGASVSATLTPSARQYVTPLTFEALGAAPVFTDMYPAALDTFGHLEPAQNADALLIAPATANTLARLAHGLADDMLACQALAFEGPILLAPAMNPRMWNAAATRANWETLIARGCTPILPACGAMACGESGEGRLAEVDEIVLAAMRALAPKDLAGRTILIDLGPTREPWDGVRFWTNPSTGTMGAALAVAAWLRGAEVTVVRGPVNPWLPAGITVVPVTTAREMFDACTELWPAMDMACLTAAVADFRPVPFGSAKFKKADSPGGLSIAFEPNPDILKRLGETKQPRQLLMGFAAETANLEAHARDKLARKNLDVIAANLVGVPGSGFATPDNTVTVLDRSGRLESWPTLSKPEVAWRLWDIALQL